jgi:hypothetical protein
LSKLLKNYRNLTEKRFYQRLMRWRHRYKNKMVTDTFCVAIIFKSSFLSLRANPLPLARELPLQFGNTPLVFGSEPQLFGKEWLVVGGGTGFASGFALLFGVGVAGPFVAPGFFA